MNVIDKIISPLMILMSVALTNFFQHLRTKINQSFELKKERLKFRHDDAEKRRWLIRERLEKLHLIVGEISREFSLTFLTIDWEANIKRSDYHEKYRFLCIKLEEMQMISDLYFQDISDDISSLGGYMNCYWGNFSQLLSMEKQGEKVSHNSQCYKNAFAYSNSILEKAHCIKKEIRKKARLIMNDYNA